MSNDRSLIIRINGDAEGLRDEFNRIKKETQGLQDGLSSIAKNSAIAFAGLTAAITGTIISYRGAEQAQLRTEAVIKSTGMAAGITADEVSNMASSFESVTTFADDAIQSGQNLLLTFTNIGKDVFPQATEAMLNMSTALGQDLSSSAIQLGKALNDPIQGVSALNRVGVQFTQSQKDIIEQLVKTNKLSEAQAIILKELEKQMGNAAKAAAQGTGIFLQLKNSLDNVFEAIGKVTFEILEPFIIKLKEVTDSLKNNEGFTTATGYVLVFGAALTGLIAIMASVGLGFLSLRAGLGALGISFSAAWAAGTLGLSLIIPAVAYAIDKFIGFDKVITGISASFTYVYEVGEKALNGLINGLNAVAISALEALVAIAKITPGLEGVVTTNQKMIDYLKQKNEELIESNNKLGRSYSEIYDQIDAEKAGAKIAAEEKAKYDEREKALQAELDQIAAQNQKKLEQNAAFKAQVDAQKAIERDEREIAAIEDLKFQQEKDALRLVYLKNHIEAMKKIRDKDLADKQLQDNKTNDELRAAKIKFDKEQLEFTKKFGQDTLDAAVTLGDKLLKQGSALGKALHLAQKAFALADIAINTARAVTLALASAPPPLNFALAAATGAAGAAQAAAVIATAVGAKDGALVGGNGSLALGDRHPFMLERGELVVPRRNFNEVVEATARSRGFSNNQGGANGNVVVQIDMTDNAAQFITARQYENSTLGIDRA